ncbi:MAG: hypothetical protein PHP44_12595 [Kiritimatiellae bacterium]|nr:hypothetical protein [Kiritimatiellia bacterium]
MFAVKYTGAFGFIKPWTAVRDDEVFSQQFLTPSIVAGIERKLFPELLQMNSGNDDGEIKRIVGHRLSYKQMDTQQEQTQTRGWNETGRGKTKTLSRPKSILVRSVLVDPILWLAFEEYCHAEIAAQQHIHLCRNEDILYPQDGSVCDVTREEFERDAEKYSGFELIFEQSDESFLVGYNRYRNAEPMYGRLKVVGTPVRCNY